MEFVLFDTKKVRDPPKRCIRQRLLGPGSDDRTVSLSRQYSVVVRVESVKLS
jgi:hypothetical protein